MVLVRVRLGMLMNANKWTDRICDVLHGRSRKHAIILHAEIDQERAQGHVLCAGNLVAHNDGDISQA